MTEKLIESKGCTANDYITLLTLISKANDIQLKIFVDLIEDERKCR